MGKRIPPQFSRARVTAIAVLGILVGQAAGTWVKLNLPEGSVRQMHFVSPDTGFLLLAHGDSDIIYRTTDGGLSFADVVRAPGPNTAEEWLQPMQFPSARIGYYGTGMSFWKTTDCGDNWVRCTGMRQGLDVTVEALHFADELHGCMLSGYQGYRGSRHFECTSDGGSSWLQVAIPDSSGRRWYRVWLLDSLRWVLSGARKVFRSWDAGRNWSLVREFHSDTLTGSDTVLTSGLQFTDSLAGLGAAQVSFRRGHENLTRSVVLRTTDGGCSWERAFSPGADGEATEYEILSLTLESRSTSYVAYVRIGSRDQLGVARTTNGTHFSRLALPPPRRFGWGLLCCVPGTQTLFLATEQEVETGPIGWRPALFKSVDAGGESLGFWEPGATVPDKLKKGALMAYAPEPATLFLLDRAIGQLRCYDIGRDSWYLRRSLPGKLRTGSMTCDGQTLALMSGQKKECWRYWLEGDSWSRMPDVPGKAKVGRGAAITTDEGDPLFVLKGGKTNEFWSYDDNTGQWTQRPSIPGIPVKAGGCLACDGAYVFALKGGKSNEAWCFDIAADTWFRLPDIPGSGVKDGTCLAANLYAGEQHVVALKGGSSECWDFRVGGYWKLWPGLPGRKKLKKGAQLVADDADCYYALRGGREPVVWLTHDLLLESEKSSSDPNGFSVLGKSRMQPSATIPAVQFVSPASRLIPVTGSADWQRVSVYDASGKLVARASNPGGTAGPDLLPGVYLVVAQGQGKSLTQHVVITR
jgi:photosystem II stability/assembly factor-like uncharacterized protein